MTSLLENIVKTVNGSATGLVLPFISALVSSAFLAWPLALLWPFVAVTVFNTHQVMDAYTAFYVILFVQILTMKPSLNFSRQSEVQVKDSVFSKAPDQPVSSKA